MSGGMTEQHMTEHGELLAVYEEHFTGDQSIESRMKSFRGRTTFRTLVTGSRVFSRPDLVVDSLDILHAACRVKRRRMVLREGGCRRGPDKTAHDWGVEHGGLVTENRTPDMVILDTLRAPWEGSLGLGAGMARNTDMVDLGADVCLAFIEDESSGASDCAEKAEKAGIVTIFWRIDSGVLTMPPAGWGHLVPL